MGHSFQFVGHLMSSFVFFHLINLIVLRFNLFKFGKHSLTASLACEHT